jgi:hypothetical protein
MRKVTPLVLATIVPALLLTACTSALKKRCESTNWFEYGETVAKRGQRTSSDSFVLDCEKEEAKVDHSSLSQGFQKGLDEYCTPDFAYRMGRQGEFLSNDMCSGAMELMMKPKHDQGVRDYCQASNAEAAGATGKKYNQICPKELEAAFLPGFNQGRKKYLTGLITRKEGEVQDLDREISGIEKRKGEARQDIQRMDWDKARLQSLPASDATTHEIQQLDSRMQSGQWNIQQLDRQISDQQGKQRTLRQEIREAQGELSTL